MFFRKKIQKLDKRYYIEKMIDRRALLTDEKQWAWDHLNMMYQFKKIGNENHNKRSRGDIFYCEPFVGVHVFGKVIKSNFVNENDDLLNNCHVIVLYFCSDITLTTVCERGINISKTQYQKFFSDPLIVDDTLWNSGCFNDICNHELTKQELKIIFGFFDSHKLRICTESGIPLERHPIMEGTLAYTTEFGIISRVLQGLLQHEQEYGVDIVSLMRLNGALTLKEPVKLMGLVQHSINSIYYSELDMLEIGVEQQDIMQHDKKVCGNGYDMEVIFNYIIQKYYPQQSNKYKFDSSAQVFLLITEDKKFHENVPKLFAQYIFDSKQFAKIIEEVKFED